ncbi:MAG TPA: class I SAM-dependent methyltransferase [Saprospiraceae bacterium]|nr:class I SAM-dependent methyltransferase [Saprospiraceae bacterium]
MNIFKQSKKEPVGGNEIIQREKELTAQIQEAQAQASQAQAELEELKKVSGLFPPGHFYSPIPDLEEVRKHESSIWSVLPREIEGIDLNDKGQLQLLKKFSKFYEELPFKDEKLEGLRYFFQNPAYSYSDAIVLYSMIRFAKPRHIIEVGSGFSSCVTLDTNEVFFDGKIKTTFIEPFPNLFYSLLKEGDREKVRVLPIPLQDVSLAEFDELGKNDILFIDSTHVSKINSDVNYIFFKILPRLKSGVIVHFHDIFYPFEYPKDWIYEGRAWNEDYLLRAFLQYNSAFQVMYFNAFMGSLYEDQLQRYMPLCLKNRGGSIWLRKL